MHSGRTFDIMVDLDKINWVESQNSFSTTSRRTIGRQILYNYYKGHQKKRYRIGRFRYSIDGDIKMSNLDKELTPSGIDSDGRAYYWHYFHNSCSFEKYLDYDKNPSLKNDRFIVNRLNAGKWKFNHNAYACITRAISELKLQLRSDQSLVVLFPSNKMVNKEVQKKYQTEFIELLKQDHITFVVGNINKVEEKKKQLIVVVIDLVTTIKRKNYIISDIRNKKAQQKPLVAMYSLVVIFDEKVGQFCIDLHEFREKQQIEKAKETVRFVRDTHTVDEEELIMRSLAGYGPDPEIFGY